ncbi:MAG: NAD(+) diphosphatase [Pseudomonadota bacterium]
MTFIRATRPNIYSGMPLDRLDHRRSEETLIEFSLAKGDARVLLLWRSRHLVTVDQRPLWVDRRLAEKYFAEGHQTVFLGQDETGARLAIDLSILDPDRLAQDVAPEAQFQDLRQIAPLLPDPEGATLAYARALMIWHQRHRFCGLCGGLTISRRAGHVRVCRSPDCGAQHFPRTDPAVIMLVHDGADSCLLGRQKNWPAGRHSTLAGFVEPGESLEEAVAREIYEEVGLTIPVSEVHYHSSQPWPFPSSIMLGFIARAERAALTICEEELDSAAWFTKDQLLNSPEDETFGLPSGDSIARRLIEDWLASL